MFCLFLIGYSLFGPISIALLLTAVHPVTFNEVPHQLLYIVPCTIKICSSTTNQWVIQSIHMITLDPWMKRNSHLFWKEFTSRKGCNHYMILKEPIYTNSIKDCSLIIQVQSWAWSKYDFSYPHTIGRSQFYLLLPFKLFLICHGLILFACGRARIWRKVRLEV